MIKDCLNWLPDNALIDGSVEEILLDPIKAWQEKWFVPPEDVILVTGAISDPISLAADLSVTANNDEAALAFLGGDEAINLGKRLLNIDRESADNTPQDRELLKRVGLESLEDLATILSDAALVSFTFAPLSDAGNQTQIFAKGVAFSLRFGRDCLGISLFMSRGLATEIRKSLLPISVSRSIKLGSFNEAISTRRLIMGAHVGTATASYNDIKTLTRGDVIILDNMAGAPIRATLSNAPVSDLRFHVSNNHNKTHLELSGMHKDTLHE